MRDKLNLNYSVIIKSRQERKIDMKTISISPEDSIYNHLIDFEDCLQDKCAKDFGADYFILSVSLKRILVKNNYMF